MWLLSKFYKSSAFGKTREDMISKYNYGATKCQKNLVVGEECVNYDNDAQVFKIFLI